MDKKKRSLLLTFGSFMVVLFVIAAVLNAFQINRSYSSMMMERMQAQAQQTTDYARAELQSYRALPWLIDYWERNHAQMEIPARALDSEDWVLRHEKYYYDSVKDYTVREVEDLSAEDQKAFAEVCYVRCASFFDKLKQDFHLVDLSCSAYRGQEESFAFFKALDEETRLTRYVLGEMWPYHMDLHPVAEKVMQTGSHVNEIEHAVSTTDGVDYMFVYTPLVIEGQVKGMICETLEWSEVQTQVLANVRKVELVNFFFLVLVFVLAMTVIYRIVIRPLFFIQKNVRRYKREKDSAAARQELEKLAGSSDEIGFLAADISGMVEEIDRYVEEERTAAAERERIRAELDTAAGIQTGMLPADFPAFPGRTDFEIYAIMEPAREVGGDFYDFFMTDDDHLAMVIADVSGKGIPAALFMTVSRTVIKSILRSGMKPARALAAANDLLYEDNKEQMFVTAWIGILDLSTGRLTFADAGHEKPVLFQKGKWILLDKKHKALPLGIFDTGTIELMNRGRCFADQEILLEPGEGIFQYTDGVTEARDPAEKMFGENRLLAACRELSAAEPTRVLTHLRSAVDLFVSDTPQFDDMTMLGVIYRGPGAS